jgi:hypothetical protein
MKAKSIKGNSSEEIKATLEQSMVDGFKPTLAIVFMSVTQDRNEICGLLHDSGISVFGATSNGEFIDENFGKGSIAMLLLDMDTSCFRILQEEYPQKNYRAITRDIAQKTKDIFDNPAFLIAGSNMATDAEELLLGFEDAIGKDVNVFGGMAGDDYNFKEQFVFTSHFSSNNGVVVLALDEDKIIIKGKATCGWRPVGTEKIVTRSVGNHVYTIEDKPVLELTIKYGGLENVSRENTNEATALEIATTFPLQLQRSTGDPVMRPGLIVDFDDGSFICSGSVPQGSKVRFSLPPDFDVMEKVIKGCEEMKANEMPDADALIVFSCAGRILSLGPMMNMEIEGVRKVWNVPLVGMFSNAELARATNGNLEMHNLTTCCVALKEK